MTDATPPAAPAVAGASAIITDTASPPRRSRLAALRATVGEIAAMLKAVNAVVVEIDKRWAAYAVAAEAVAVIPRLGGFVIGASLLGSFVSSTRLTWPTVLLAIAGYAVYMAATTVIKGWAQERWRLFTDLLSTHLELRRVEHLARLDLGRLVDPAFIELTALAMRRGFAAIEGIFALETRMIGASVSLVVSAGVLAYLDPLLGLLAVLIAVPNIAQRWLSEKKRRELDLSETMVRRVREEAYSAITSPRTSAFMRLLRFTERFLADYRRLTGVLVGNVRTIAAFDRRWSMIAGGASVLAMVLLGLYFASGLVAGRYTIVELGAIAGSLQLVAGALSNFGSLIGAFAYERKNYAYLQAFFATKPLVEETDCAAVSFAATPRLTLDHVGFTYPGQSAPASIDVSTEIAPGDKIALVGPNGSGKTTLLRLLSRTYTPSSGEIRADATPLAKMLQASWIAHMVMATQAPTLPGMEIARAVTGEEPEKVDRARLDRALALANAADLVAGLPHGLATFIGEEWPNGRGFSTGEQQRLALAAALYRFLEPSVFVAMFDEPTANCDAETKAAFYEGITKAAEFSGKTVIVSLHDPLYLTFFDRVLQFESGRLIHDLRGKDEIQRYQDEIAKALAKDL
ncbi:MAG: ABC transporter ATP-binding protein [Bauldia sp.]